MFTNATFLLFEERMFLFDNALSGSLPTEIGMLTNLRAYYDTCFVCFIACFFCYKTYLIHSVFLQNSGTVSMELNDNQIGGVIPSEIGSLSMLGKLPAVRVTFL